ncbi:MAG: ATP-dependent 6-phosphofructokinase [Malacoplasma sp.]
MKKVAILTSGGDATAMNKTISSLVHFANKENIESYLVYGGYEGLYNNKILKADFNEVRTWSNLPGTKILSSRFPEFKDKKIREQCISNLKKLDIEALIVIGGDGSYIGALRLCEDGFNVLGLPGTIDNDVASSTYTIGFDSSLNQIVDRVNEIKSCMDSHSDIAIVEIMGRHCVDLTVFAAIATAADIVITYENFITPQKLLEKINDIRIKRPLGSIMVLVTELLLGTDKRPSLKDYKNYIETNSKHKTKINVLGYMQRGGKLTAMDSIRATMFAKRAIELVVKNKFGRIIGLDEFDVVDFPIVKAIKMTNPKRISLLKKFI